MEIVQKFRNHIENKTPSKIMGVKEQGRCFRPMPNDEKQIWG